MLPAKTFESFKKENPHLDDVWPFLKLLQEESDRGSVLISTGFLEQQLKDVLTAFMQEVPAKAYLLGGANAPLGTFSSRISACFTLGLITDDEHHDLNQLRRIRNAFAHDIHTTLNMQSVKDRCATLKMKAHDYDSEEMGEVRMTAQGQFHTAAVALIMNFVNRPSYVAKQRRKPQDWPY